MRHVPYALQYWLYHAVLCPVHRAAVVRGSCPMYRAAVVIELNILVEPLVWID